MKSDLHHIRLVAGIEIRPPSRAAGFILEHEQTARLSEPVADDLAACIPEATSAHLCMAGLLLEPGQILSPSRSPWNAMIEVGRLDQRHAPGVTAIGTHQANPARDSLAPISEQPSGLFVCLPLILTTPAMNAESLESRLEQTLFDEGGLKPPSLGTLFDLTGLEPVHGQLMTLVDLMALTKMQIAAAGLDAFWAPLEHALLESRKPFEDRMPADLNLDWDIDAQKFAIQFLTYDQSGLEAEDYALWLRAFRQTTALLDAHWVAWSCHSAESESIIHPDGQWLEEPVDGSFGDASSVWTQQVEGPGLVAYSAVEQGQLTHYYPLKTEAVATLNQRFKARGLPLQSRPLMLVQKSRLTLPEQ